jgi:hypothetical protein
LNKNSALKTLRCQYVLDASALWRKNPFGFGLNVEVLFEINSGLREQ